MVRSAMENLGRDYSRLAEGLGTETALTVDFELAPKRTFYVKQ